MKRTAIRLPDATYDRLRALVERSGRTAAFHIRESLERYLEDVEDLHVELGADIYDLGGMSYPPP